MASQCHLLSVPSSTSRLCISAASSASFSTNCNAGVNQPSVFLRGQRVQLQRLSKPLHLLNLRTPVQCVSSTFGSSSNNGEETQENNLLANIMAKAPEPIRVFPWGKAGNLFVQRLLHQFWTVGKYLAIPVLAASMLSELSYTLLQEKVLIIPAGMIGGFAFAGMMKETAVELAADIEVGQFPWHLVALGFMFGALKFIGPYLPAWGRVSVPHFANGGLWHVIKLVIDWRRQQAEKTKVRSR
ncbi:uncharacterized protein [Physcomitrium patens]|uniref:Uncharacterized protein n=1 Tax=Physcomitrium patens TaxID=3218 RepID=A0A2K1IIB3_PHYPA|nr:uncharacterized protein LOC112276066 [Physcomitrium patens]PNR29015.1 hypothetical protein PHYPA_027707 [Physcomitrium patens]|eukprot:XP_024362805.1 uncharacterized protein LOC112276066 [Physcomitrella patens]